MAVYNLGTIGGENPGASFNKFGDALMEYALKNKLQQREIEGRKDIASIDRATQLQVAANKAKAEQDEKSRTYLDALVQKGVDKFGNEEFSRLAETDDGYSDLYKRYITLHPEFKGITDIKATLPQTTKDQVKEQLDTSIVEVKKKLLSGGPESLSEGERGLLQMEGFKDDYAEVVASVVRNPEAQYMTMQEKQQLIKDGMALLKGRTSPMSLPTPKDSSYRPMNMSEWSTSLYPETALSPTKPTSTKPTRFKVRELK